MSEDLLCSALESLVLRKAGLIKVCAGVPAVDGGATSQLNLERLHELTLPWVGEGKDPSLAPGEECIKIHVKILTGQKVELQVNPKSKIQDLKTLLQGRFGIPVNNQRLVFVGRQLEDGRTLADSKIVNNANLVLFARETQGGGEGATTYFLDPNLRDPQWDYDFTRIKDTRSFFRGGLPYYRPCGWRRLALKVIGKYGSNDWLGSSGKSQTPGQDEWPVSYHGTNAMSSMADGDAISRGILSTPSPVIAAQYAAEFQHEGITYQVMMQNRVNAKASVYKEAKQYYVTAQEKDIRMYGILIRETRKS